MRPPIRLAGKVDLVQQCPQLSSAHIVSAVTTILKEKISLGRRQLATAALAVADRQVGVDRSALLASLPKEAVPVEMDRVRRAAAPMLSQIGAHSIECRFTKLDKMYVIGLLCTRQRSAYGIPFLVWELLQPKSWIAGCR
jgi:hypothetical protein